MSGTALNAIPDLSVLDELDAELTEEELSKAMYRLPVCRQGPWRGQHPPRHHEEWEERIAAGLTRAALSVLEGGHSAKRHTQLQDSNSLQHRVYPESQCGFRAGRSTFDMVFSVRQLQEKCREQNKPLYLAFIDLMKAFDLVSRSGLLKKVGCPQDPLPSFNPSTWTCRACHGVLHWSNIGAIPNQQWSQTGLRAHPSPVRDLFLHAVVQCFPWQ